MYVDDDAQRWGDPEEEEGSAWLLGGFLTRAVTCLPDMV